MEQREKQIVFPVDGGTQTMVLVDRRPYGLAPGYYPVATNANATRTVRSGEEASGGPRGEQGPRDSGRVRALNNTARSTWLVRQHVG